MVSRFEIRCIVRLIFN